VTKSTIAIIIFAPLAAILVGLAVIYFTFKIDEDIFRGELDFDTVDF
jgi:hypothetical protein